MKKARDTDRNHGMAQVANLAAEAPDVQFVRAGARRNADRGGADNNSFRKSVWLVLVDTDREAVVTIAATGNYKWDCGPCHCVAIMKSASLL